MGGVAYGPERGDAVSPCFTSDGRLSFHDWPTVRLEIIALRALEELAKRGNRTAGWENVVFDWNWPPRA